MDGGAGGVNKLTFDIGTGNSFSYTGSVSNFADSEVSEQQGEPVRFHRRSRDRGTRAPNCRRAQTEFGALERGRQRR